MSATTRVIASLPISTMAKDDDAAGGGTEAVNGTGVYGRPSGAAALDRNPSKRSAKYQTADGEVVLGMPAEIADNNDAAVLDAHKLETTGQEQHTHIPGSQLGGGSLERLSILEVQERYETEVPYCRCGGPYFCERHLRMPEDPSADDRDFDDAFPASHRGIWEHHPEISTSRKAAFLSVNRLYVHFVNSQGNSDAEIPDTDIMGQSPRASPRTQHALTPHLWHTASSALLTSPYELVSPLNSSAIVFELGRRSDYAFAAHQTAVPSSTETYSDISLTTTIIRVLAASKTPAMVPKKAAAPGNSENVKSSVLDNTSKESAALHESSSKRAVEARVADLNVESAESNDHDYLGPNHPGPHGVQKPSATHLGEGAYGIAQEFGGASQVPDPASIGHKLEILVNKVTPGWPTERFIINLPSDSSAQEYTIDSPGFLKTKGEAASGYQLMLKALCNTTAEKIPAQYLQDTSPNPGGELENLTRAEQDDIWGITGALMETDIEHLMPDQQNELRRYLRHQHAVLEAIFSRLWASLSRDPEQNQKTVKRNGGYMWSRVCLDDGEVDYKSNLAIPCPAPARHLSGRPGYSIEKLRPIWISKLDHGLGPGPAAHFIFNFTSTEPEDMHPEERMLYIEVVHASDARAKDLEDVVIVEGPNVLRPDLKYFMQIEPVPFKWSDAMVELTPGKFEEVSEESGQEEEVMPRSRAERRRQQREADAKSKRNGQIGGGSQKKPSKN
ncbi:hypothetical protein CBER1_04136 [Cercospora berteroae]|uniref:Uncharacterized protein n=1 Tax=Cercospora berteroae TaxID=357750 RepID=A0A2S6CGY4_9PEZI|nr:hypothetical protein CBER1_04136 [Cercospora berteroae]